MGHFESRCSQSLKVQAALEEMRRMPQGLDPHRTAIFYSSDYLAEFLWDKKQGRASGPRNLAQSRVKGSEKYLQPSSAFGSHSALTLALNCDSVFALYRRGINLS